MEIPGQISAEIDSGIVSEDAEYATKCSQMIKMDRLACATRPMRPVELTLINSLIYFVLQGRRIMIKNDR
jgi:hypothetical protein